MHRLHADTTPSYIRYLLEHPQILASAVALGQTACIDGGTAIRV